MKKKILVLSVAMAALLAMPTNMLAQSAKRGSLFGGQTFEQNEDGLLNQNGNRTGEYEPSATLTLGGATTENPTPVGSGIAILLVAGAGYVALKKKENKQ